MTTNNIFTPYAAHLQDVIDNINFYLLLIGLTLLRVLQHKQLLIGLALLRTSNRPEHPNEYLVRKALNPLLFQKTPYRIDHASQNIIGHAAEKSEVELLFSEA